MLTEFTNCKDIIQTFIFMYHLNFSVNIEIYPFYFPAITLRVNLIGDIQVTTKWDFTIKILPYIYNE